MQKNPSNKHLPHVLKLMRALSALTAALHIATTASIALPSTGMSALKQQTTNLNAFQKGYDGLNKGVIDKMDRNNKLEDDQATPSYPQKYGSSQHGGMVPNGTREVPIAAPTPQAQKETKPSSADNQGQMATELSYFNMGGKNIAIPGPPPGKPWYHLPMDNTNVTAKGELAHYGYAKAAFTMFPQWQRSGLETSSQHQVTQMIGAIIQAQLANSPAAKVNQARANSQAQQQGAADASANVAENSLGTGMTLFRENLINVANEQAGSGPNLDSPIRELSNAVGMVQQMFKRVYVPFAVLLLLPGALLTNLKGIIAGGILSQSQDEDAVSPFTGILRTMIAIFLIPGTQLIISWATDIGNSMTYEVQKLIEPAVILDWAKEQAFDAPIKNSVNHLKLPQGGDLAGKIDAVKEEQSKVEQQSAATRMLQMSFNFMNAALGVGIAILLAFQVVMMCYLLLMGPIAAAFFAWPSAVGSLFKNVFVNWVDAVTNLALWRFWWCVVVLCMQTRIQWLSESGGYQPNETWEMAVFTAFMVILTYVPFIPFEYKPGEMVAKLLEKASEAQKGGAGVGGGKSGGHGASEGASAMGGKSGAPAKASAGPAAAERPAEGPAKGPQPQVAPPPSASGNNGQPKLEDLIYHPPPPPPAKTLSI
jgi:hypothetical protein